jgi:hypothetical protein
MAYILSWRRPKPSPELDASKIIQEYCEAHPGCKWKPYIPLTDSRPIQYLEIGVRHGCNVTQVARSYALHPESKVYCVDPWFDYSDYPEYKGDQDNAYDFAMQKIDSSPHKEKFVICRGLSDDVVPTFEDNKFDLAFIDGNHETEYVYRDGVMVFQKVKAGGYIIFDDYCAAWLQTVAGVDRFLKEYKSHIRIIAHPSVVGQVIVQKL